MAKMRYDRLETKRREEKYGFDYAASGFLAEHPHKAVIVETSRSFDIAVANIKSLKSQNRVSSKADLVVAVSKAAAQCNAFASKKGVKRLTGSANNIRAQKNKI